MKKKRGSNKKVKVTQKWVNIQLIIFAILVVLILALATINVGKARGYFIPKQPKIEVTNGVVDLDSLSLEQKIAQMIIVQGNVDHMQAWKNLQVGGMHLYGRKSEHVFRNTIIDFQYTEDVPFFFTVDLEGCVNPFGAFRNFTAASEIKTLGDAFEKGFREGEFLRGLGVNLNFAPVVDLDDQIWKCRAFPGNEQEIAEFAQAYLLGLQNQGVIATIKHYPGKTLVNKDPHKFVVGAQIEEKDVFPYEYLFERGDAAAVMVSHIIVNGSIDSKGIPSVASKEIIDDIKTEYGGLVISDEIHMLGLKNYYSTLDEVYIAVFYAGNDIILNFDNDPNEIHRMIQVVADAVRRGEISEEQIDISVTKVLEAKGFTVNKGIIELIDV